MEKTKSDSQRPDWIKPMIGYIIRHLDWFPPRVREEFYQLVGEIAPDPREGRALFELLTRDLSVSATAAKYQIPVNRLARMKRKFYETFLAAEIRRR